MAKPILYFSVTEGNVTDKKDLEKQVRKYFKAQNIKVRKVTCYENSHNGVVVFQKRDAMDGDRLGRTPHFFGGRRTQPAPEGDRAGDA